MKYVLEGHRFFPYVAWALVISFVFFTYSLTIRLTQATDSLGEKTHEKVDALQKNKHN